MSWSGGRNVVSRVLAGSAVALMLSFGLCGAVLGGRGYVRGVILITGFCIFELALITLFFASFYAAHLERVGTRRRYGLICFTTTTLGASVGFLGTFFGFLFLESGLRLLLWSSLGAILSAIVAFMPGSGESVDSISVVPKGKE